MQKICRPYRYIPSYGPDEVCDNEQPLTRVHSEDLHNVLLRMLSMFDIVDTHGADSSMNGTVSLEHYQLKQFKR